MGSTSGAEGGVSEPRLGAPSRSLSEVEGSLSEASRANEFARCELRMKEGCRKHDGVRSNNRNAGAGTPTLALPHMK